MASKITLRDELLFPSEYIQAVEFKGKDVTLTIVSISKQELQVRGGQKKLRPVLTFKETKKKLVCNATNAESIAAEHGSKAELWVGKRITLYPSRTRFGAEVVDCIRVRESAPAPAPESDAITPDEADRIRQQEAAEAA